MHRFGSRWYELALLGVMLPIPFVASSTGCGAVDDGESVDVASQEAKIETEACSIVRACSCDEDGYVSCTAAKDDDGDYQCRGGCPEGCDGQEIVCKAQVPPSGEPWCACENVGEGAA